MHKQTLSFIEGNSASAGAVFWNTQTQQFNPGTTVNWVGAERYIAAFPERGELVHRVLPFYPLGPIITVGASNEKINRLIQFFDWMTTEEGWMANVFGREGETFEYRDGMPHYLPNIWLPSNPDAPFERYYYGLHELLLFPHWWVMHHRGEDQVLPGLNFSNAQMDKDWVKAIAWQFTPEERKDLADIEVTVNDIYQAYASRFINGELDPSTDRDWQRYMSELEKAGLTKMMIMYNQAWIRMGMPK